MRLFCKCDLIILWYTCTLPVSGRHWCYELAELESIPIYTSARNEAVFIDISSGIERDGVFFMHVSSFPAVPNKGIHLRSLEIITPRYFLLETDSRGQPSMEYGWMILRVVFLVMHIVLHLLVSERMHHLFAQAARLVYILLENFAVLDALNRPVTDTVICE